MPAFDAISPDTLATSDLHQREGGPPYRAGIDHLQLPYLSGWALDLREPERAVGVAVLVDGVVLGRCEALHPRPDLEEFVPEARPGFLLDMQGCAPEDVAAVVGRLLQFGEERLSALAPIGLRLDDEAGYLAGPWLDFSARQLLALLMQAAPASLAETAEVDHAPGAGRAALVATLSTEVMLFDEAAWLHDHPRLRDGAQDAARGLLGAAFRDWLEQGAEAHGHPEATPVSPGTEAILRAELALAEGRPGAARHWLHAALTHLRGPQPHDVGEAVEAALSALEVGGEESGAGAALLARLCYAGALALGPEAAEALMPRLATLSLALHPAMRAGPSRDTDLHWWARLAPLLLREAAPPFGAVRALCLDAWRQISPEQRRRRETPVPPTLRMRRLLLLCWAASAHAAGEDDEALAAALGLSRELVSMSEQPWRSLARRALMAAYEGDGPVPAATLAAILCACFEGGFGPRRLSACGALLRRLGLPAAGMMRLRPPEEPARRRLDIAFLIGMREGESYRYRVLNIADALEDQGLAVTTLLAGEHEALLEGSAGLGRLVVFRAALDGGMLELLEAANRLGASVSFDVDDLVFDPAAASQIKVLDLVSASERAHTLGWMRRYREAMLAADSGTVSTPQLRTQMEALGLPASVVVNTHGPFERAIARRARRVEGGPLTIAYFSGTWTHHADFAQCDAALRAVLRRHKDIRFLLAGNLQLGPEWAGLEAQVERAPFLPHPMMLPLHAQVDIMLAPLELDSAFCDSKSELKIFEAALFAVPSIASPTGPYSAAIEAGVSGLLARTPEEWEAALEALIADPALRASMGAAARERSWRDFADTGAAAGFAAGLAAERLGASLRRRLSLAVVLPQGLAARDADEAATRAEVLALCRGLAVLGHEVVACAGPHEGRDGLRGLRHALAGSGVRLEHKLPALPFDIVLAATAAALPPVLAACEAQGGNPLRLALAYEPWLHPVGEARLRAEASLCHAVPTIARTPFLARLLREMHGVEAAHFDLAPDRAVWFARPEVERSAKQVVVLTRPGLAASCHGLAMRALRLLRARRPRLEIVLLGSGAEAGLGAPLVRHGWPMHPDAAARIFSEGTVGLCLSPAGPSLEALQMVACGLPVVDLDWAGRRFASQLEREAILGVAPEAEAIAGALHRLLEDEVARERHLAAGEALLDGLPGPIGQARQIEALLLGLAP